MSQHRFRFFGAPDGAGRWVVRDPEELTHLSKVLRLSVGADVEATDGAGAFCEGVLTEIAKTAAVIAVRAEGFRAAPERKIVLGIGALKHGAFDEILPGLVELGVDAVHLFLQDGADKTRLAPKAVERWHRIAGQALKQCKRVHLPGLTTHTSFAAFLAALAAGPDGRRERLVLAPGANLGLLAALTAAFARQGGAGVTLVVGGEQGLDADELEALQDGGFTPVHCGDGILRAVTAALAAASAATLVRG